MTDPVELDFESTGAEELTGAIFDLVDATHALRESMEELASAASEAEGASEEFAESAEDQEEATDKAGLSLTDMKSAFDFTTAAVGKAIDAFMAVGAAIADFGNELERQLAIMNHAEGSITAASQAIGGTVSNIDLMIARNRLMQAGIQLSNEDFAALTEVANDFADATGGDAVAAIDQLGGALTSGSGRALARFGLEVDSTKTRVEQAAQSFELLRERAAALGSDTDTLGGSFEQLDVLIENAETEMLAAFDATSGLGEAFGALGDQVQVLADGLGVRLPTAMEFARLVGATFAGILQTIVERIGAFIEAHRVLIAALRGGDFDAAAEAIRSIGDALNPIEAFSDAVAHGVDGFRAATERATAAEGDLETVIHRTTTAHRSAGNAANEHRDALIALADEVLNDRTTSVEEEMAAEAARFNAEKLVAAADALKAHEEIERQSAERRLAEQARTNEQAAEQQRELVTAATEASTAFADAWRNGVGGVISALEQANEAALEAGTAMVSSLDAAGAAAAAAASDIGESLLGGIANAFAGAAKAAIKGEKSFGDALAGMLEDTLFSIGTQAIVLSVFEFARAIADAASLNAPGAAAHAAAGAAYAAVGVLAFAGGAAAASATPSAPSAAAPSAPAAPEGTGGSGTTGGGSVTVIFQGPIVTAATTAEMGRQISDVIASGDRRYGRAA